MDRSSLRLFQILIAKSIAETLLVGTLAVIFFFTTLPPYFHGWGEAAPEAIVGWVVNDSQPWDRVEVQLFIDGQFIANGVANLPRPDVMAAGWSKDQWHGYAFFPRLLTAGIHEARVYAIHESGGGVRKTLQLVGNPIRFASDESGKLADLTNLKP